ncbi:FIG139976: hypothetical protein [hydrothermal vent metagenome]|uniref:Gonadoliberin III-related protein n=1 Tax=hydrothermal vent metagenome TaxID=652676 RepID=A0A1W1EDX6_9ZZZZ
MSNKYKSLFISLTLAAIGIFLVYYKVSIIGMPFMPNETKPVYNIDAQIDFYGKGEPVLVSLALPEKQNDMQIISEDASSAGYGFTIAETNSGKRAEWAKRRVTGKQTLYYSIEVIKKTSEKEKKEIKRSKSSKEELLLDIPISLQSATKNLLKDIRWRSADPHSFAAQLIRDFSDSDPSQAVKVLLAKVKISKQDLLYKLLRYEKIDVKKINGLYLSESQRNIKLTPLLSVYDGKTWQMYDLEKGKIEKDTDFLVWRSGGTSILDVTGAKKSKVTFSITKRQVPTKHLLENKNIVKNSAILDFSLFSLPNSEQNAYRHMLLVPFGALVVVFLRVFIGLRTSGTFMPILIALAFMETTLVTGLIMFIIIVAIGLVIRSFLSSLNLLLVARISAVVIVVIMIMSFMSIFSFKLGLEEVMTITFFPMIILAWTIERMSVLWEEEGPKEVIIQGGGSLLVAVFAYLAMSNPLIGHITFNFPELLLVVLAVIILMGRYSGYRLSELIRFKSFGK